MMGVLHAFVALMAVVVPGLAFDPGTGNNVLVYWGQNSAGGSSTEPSLSDLCSDDSTDAVVIGYLNVFQADNCLPVLSLANGACSDRFNDTNLYDCSQVGDQISQCQNKGKKVLLSLGGPTGSYGFDNKSQAIYFADTVWNLFGNGVSNTRPFGSAAVDGFELDIQGGQSANYDAFITQLRTHFYADQSKSWHLSATAPCVNPNDYANAVAGLDVDWVVIQLFNSHCLNSTVDLNGNPSDEVGNWGDFLGNNKSALLGVSASSKSPAVFYESADYISNIANAIGSSSCQFAGVAVWDASLSSANGNFADNVKSALKENKCAESSPTQTTASTTAVQTSQPSTITPAPSSMEEEVVTITPIPGAQTTTVTECPNHVGMRCTRRIIIELPGVTTKTYLIEPGPRTLTIGGDSSPPVVPGARTKTVTVCPSSGACTRQVVIEVPAPTTT
ncbi:hypothetical protein TRVA0_042S00188 [Trichomonascus vanleenenianus]|uniref:uncharacterized protein n=1 Tax=Trichomonascus vanleenenianus TaxID=2268995 RepID=UPI003ECA0FCD